VHTEPCRECEPAVQLVSVLADLGDRGPATDHRHDSLVPVVERRSRYALHGGQDVLRGPVARLLGDTAELREGRLVAVRDRGDVAHRVHVRQAGQREVRVYRQPPTSALGHAHRTGQLGRTDTAAPDHEVGADSGAIAEFHVVLGHLLHRDTQT
jgi:hypothetical protein